MLDPTDSLPDETPVQNVRLPADMRHAMERAGLKTVGEVRRTSDAGLLALTDLGKESVSYLRKTLGVLPRP